MSGTLVFQPTDHNAEFNRPSSGYAVYKLAFDRARTKHELILDHNGDTDATVVRYIRTPLGGQSDETLIQADSDALGNRKKIDYCDWSWELPQGAAMADVVITGTVHGALRPDRERPGRKTQCQFQRIPQAYDPHDGALRGPLDYGEGILGDLPEITGGGGLSDEDKAFIRGELTALMSSIINAFGGDVRAGIQNKSEDALIWLTNPANVNNRQNDPKPRIYQDALYQFVKNAAANPLQNALNGQDAWGQEQREALKDVIREVLAEPRGGAPEGNG